MTYGSERLRLADDAAVNANRHWNDSAGINAIGQLAIRKERAYGWPFDRDPLIAGWRVEGTSMSLASFTDHTNGDAIHIMFWGGWHCFSH